MKRLLGVSLIVFLFLMASASLPSRNDGMLSTPVVHAGHTGVAGVYCECLMVQGRCPCCGYSGLTVRDQGEDGEVKAVESIDLPGRLVLTVLRLVVLRRF